MIVVGGVPVRTTDPSAQAPNFAPCKPHGNDHQGMFKNGPHSVSENSMRNYNNTALEGGMQMVTDLADPRMS